MCFEKLSKRFWLQSTGVGQSFDEIIIGYEESNNTVIRLYFIFMFIFPDFKRIWNMS